MVLDSPVLRESRTVTAQLSRILTEIKALCAAPEKETSIERLILDRLVQGAFLALSRRIDPVKVAQ
jgi:hypothetical protein